MTEPILITEEWEGAPWPRHSLRWSVKVSGPLAVVVTKGRLPVSYRIGQVRITWEWTDPNADDAPGEPFVVLGTLGRDGRPDNGRLFLGQLREVPEWLSSIIQRSMPRL